MPTPRPVEFRSLKQLLRRLRANRDTERETLISVDEADLPKWQRQLVWTRDEMGLLCLSILRGYPIGQMILWQKHDGVRVPIDGRQRLTAIKRFFEGRIALPDLPHIDIDLRGKKWNLYRKLTRWLGVSPLPKWIRDATRKLSDLVGKRRQELDSVTVGREVSWLDTPAGERWLKARGDRLLGELREVVDGEGSRRGRDRGEIDDGRKDVGDADPFHSGRSFDA